MTTQLLIDTPANSKLDYGTLSLIPWLRFTVAVAVGGVGRLAVGVVVAVADGNATSGFPDKSIQNYLHRYELTEALVPAPWHGT
jgi:hypothetical protein